MQKKVVVDYVAMGKRIRKYRERIGLTQGELASRVGLSNTTLSHIECGKGRPELNNLVMIANELGVTFDSMLCESLKVSEKQFKCELAELLDSCSSDELRFLAYVAPGILEGLRQVNGSKTDECKNNAN